jgi:uncharacterized BrkB/YihY/UPF0761 family membrane protein
MIARLRAIRDQTTARVEMLRRRTLEISPVRQGVVALTVYNRAGGGLLTAGLAYRVLVTLLPGLALVVGFVGLVVSDPALQEQIAQAVVDAFPPLEPIAGDALLALASGAVPLSLLGLIGLAWTSSALYGTLDDAIARVFAGAPRRDVIRRRILGVVLVAAALGLVVAFLVLSTFAGIVLGRLGLESDGPLVTALAQVGGLLAPVAMTILVYGTMPRRRLPLRVVLTAGLVAGALISGFTAIFQFIAPRLVGGSLALFGSFVALFAALIWLGIVVQILLLGAAWMEVATRVVPRGSADDGRSRKRSSPG